MPLSNPSFVMTDATRAAVAFLVGTLINEQRRGGVFDYRRGRFIAMSLALNPPHALVHSEPMWVPVFCAPL